MLTLTSSRRADEGSAIGFRTVRAPHSHIGNAECPGSNARLRKASPDRQFDPSRRAEIDAVDSHAVTTSTTEATKGSSESGFGHKSIPIVPSDVDPSKDIGTGCGYRGWNYAKADVALSIILDRRQTRPSRRLVTDFSETVAAIGFRTKQEPW